ncbi:MAG TPA: ERCC4 domain-containing protein [Actinomycetes bacterium]|nr:ERCC4 domain-containing protein [Actinomycetes bacterium]
MAATARTFLVARNPDPTSRLPYQIRLPLAGGPLVLKAREPWPRTAKVYCHRAEGWPEDADVLEQVPVRSCVRRGVAIDLVLDRPRENRSQFVFTVVQGREAIFWQSARTAAQARPGVRVPRRRAAGHHAAELEILVDTRERYPYRFAGKQARTRRRALPAGDYAVELDGQLAGAVERKRLADLVGGLVDGGLAFQLADLACLPRAAVVVEDRYSAVFKLDHVQPGFVAELLAAVQVRYPAVPVVFLETRPLAEEWTFRFLGAALAHARVDTEP